MTDPIDIATGGAVGTIGGMLTALGAQWLRSRTAGRAAQAEERQAAESRRAAEAAAAATVAVERVRAEVPLSQQLAAVHARVEELHRQCDEDRRLDREECDRQRAADRAERDRLLTQMQARHTSARLQDRAAINQLLDEAATLRRDLGEVASRAAGEMRRTHPDRWDDSTAVVALERIARRPPSDPRMRALTEDDDDG